MNHELRAEAILRRVKAGETVVEVGVFRGELSAELLFAGLNVVMVDDYLVGMAHPAPYRATGDYHTQVGRGTINRAAGQAIEVARQFANQATIVRNRSLHAARSMQDRSVDLVFLDGDHSYEGVKEDWHEWLPKVRPGGWMAGHDYGDKRFGVKKAIDESLAFWHKLELDLDMTWFVQQ